MFYSTFFLGPQIEQLHMMIMIKKTFSLFRLPTIRWNHFWRSILIFLPLLIKVFTNDFIQKYTYLENLKWKKLRNLLQKCFDSNVLPFSFFCSISLFFIEKLHNKQNNKLNSVPKCYAIFTSSIHKMKTLHIFYFDIYSTILCSDK